MSGIYIEYQTILLICMQIAFETVFLLWILQWLLSEMCYNLFSILLTGFIINYVQFFFFHIIFGYYSYQWKQSYGKYWTCKATALSSKHDSHYTGKHAHMVNFP